jgi:hypothetical protein
LTERDIARISADAIRTPVGRNYISVSREVTQSLKNSTVRIGIEQIVLHGVKTGDIRPSDVAAVQDALSGLFALLQELTDTIDWRSAGRSTVVVRSELLQWIERLEQIGIPRFDVGTSHDQPTRKLESTGNRQPRRSALKWIVCGAVIAVSLVIASVLIGWLIDAGPHRDPPTPTTPSSAVFMKLAHDWECTPDELGASLLRAANWENRKQAEMLGSDFALTDGEVLAILDKINANNQPDRFFVSPAVAGEDGFRGALEHRAKSAIDARDLRRWLFESWQAFSDFKQFAIRAEKYLREDDGEFAGFIKRVANIGGDVGIGDGFHEPKSPLFDRQDVMIYHLLGGDVRQAMSDAGVVRILLASSGEVEPNDLPSLLRALGRQRGEITRVIGEHRKNVVDRVKNNGGDDDAVFSAYKRCELLLLHLLAFEDSCS